MQLVLATHNRDKVKELQLLLQPLEMKVRPLTDFPQVPEIEETGTTLAENARLKALLVHQITGLPALADDTGLEVDALNGAPGVYSARYAGEDCTYQDNVKKLLQELQGIPRKNRTARFRTIAVFIDQQRELSTEGVVEGWITDEPKGVAGFGYDPVFYVIGAGKTFAEMTPTEKNTLSHRGLAFRQMLARLQSIYSLPNSHPEETA